MHTHTCTLTYMYAHTHTTPKHIIHVHSRVHVTYTPHTQAYIRMPVHVHIPPPHACKRNTQKYTPHTLMYTHMPRPPLLTWPSFPSLSLSIRPVRHLLRAVAGSLSQLLTWLHRVSVQLLCPLKSPAQSSLMTSQLALSLLPPLVTTRVQPAWPLCSPAVGSVEASLKAHPLPSNSCLCCSVHMPWCQPGPRSTCQQVCWEPAIRMPCKRPACQASEQGKNRPS